MPLKSRQLEAMLTEASPLTASEIDQRLRALREYGRLPSLGRGPHAAALTAAQAARILNSVAGARSAREAIVADSNFLGLVSRSDGTMFLQALERILDGTGTESVRSVRWWLERRFVAIVRDGQDTEYFGPKDGRPTPEDDSSGLIVEIVEVGGDLIRRISREIAEAEAE